MLLVAKALGCRVIVEFNSDVVSEADSLGKSFMRRKFVKFAQWFHVRAAEKVVVVSEGIRINMIEKFGFPENKIVTVVNGTDTDLFEPKDKSNCRAQLNLSENAHILVFSGSFQAWQGLDSLLNAFALLAEDVPGAQLYLIGSGPEEHNLRKQVENLRFHDRVVFTGWLDEEMLAQYLGAADICVAPYNRKAALVSSVQNLEDTFLNRSPLKLYTYLSIGRPVITTNYADGGKFVESIGAGVGVAVEDEAALATAISDLLKDPQKLTEYGEAGRQYAVRHGSWKAVTKKIWDLISVDHKSLTKE